MSVTGFEIQGLPNVSFYDSSGHSSGIGDLSEVVQILATNRDFYRLQLTFGGTQGLKVTVKNIDIKFVEADDGSKLAAYRADVEYVISDRYEFDNDDAKLSGPDGFGNRLLRCGVAKTILTSVTVSTRINGNVNVSNNTPTPVPKPPNVDSRLIKNIQVVGSFDPNDKVGPQGSGPENYRVVDQILPYTIYFENDPEFATAAAQQVRIVDQLSEHVDWETLELGSVGFGSLRIAVPPGVREFEKSVSTTNPDGTPLLVRVSGDIDLATGIATWVFDSLDPNTGLPPADPFAGFLPVNNKETGSGEGFVSYSVMPLASLASGAKVNNQANIFFDVNDPILTPTTTHTIDIGTPTSTVDLLPETSSDSFSVTWTGQDDAGGSGVGSYDIFVSTDDGPFELWLAGTPETFASFLGEDGKSYSFYSVATDNVGHIESKLAVAEATTTVVAGPAWQNPSEAKDTNGDNSITALDALIIINEINAPQHTRGNTLELRERTESDDFFYDVNGDGSVTALDALIIINHINSSILGSEGELADLPQYAKDTVLADTTFGNGLTPSSSSSFVNAANPSTSRSLTRLVEPEDARYTKSSDWLDENAATIKTFRSRHAQELTSTDELDALLDELAEDVTNAWN